MIISTNAEKHLPIEIRGMLMVQMGMASQVYIFKFIKSYTLNKYSFLYVPSYLEWHFLLLIYKVQYLFNIKKETPLSYLEIKGGLPNKEFKIKSILIKTFTNIILNSERLNAFLLQLKTRQMSTLITSIQCCTICK